MSEIKRTLFINLWFTAVSRENHFNAEMIEKIEKVVRDGLFKKHDLEEIRFDRARRIIQVFFKDDSKQEFWNEQ